MKRINNLVLIALLLVMTLTGCNTPKDPAQIYEEERSGVVLIFNNYYYEIKMPNGESLYFTGLDKEDGIIGLTEDLNEVKKKPGVLNGTGFFIDETGKILTNRHVVAPEIDKIAVKENLNQIIGGYAAYIESLQEEMNKKYAAIREYAANSVYSDDYGNQYTSLDDSEISALEEEVNTLKSQYAEAEEYKQNLQSNLLGDHFSVQLHSTFGIAYDGSSVTSFADFQKNPCILVKASKDEGTDLALLQLKSKKTPEDKFIFILNDSYGDEGNQLLVNDPLYMIGYNHGIQLANTNKGVRAQFTSGTVTQEPDGDRVLYSMPSMQGSSGSPVVNAYGDVVAVNFAGTVGSDNFNFGIPYRRIQLFLK